MLLAGLIVISVALTCTMFISRQVMLGLPSAMFWAITGAQAYTLSTIPWGDIYFYLAFASMFGMVSFTAFAAYGLRTKKDEIREGDTYIDEGKDDLKFIDEDNKGKFKEEKEDKIEEDSPRSRANARGNKNKKDKWAAFK